MPRFRVPLRATRSQPVSPAGSVVLAIQIGTLWFRSVRNEQVTAGDVAEAVVYAIGKAMQYAAVTLDGDGVDPNPNFPFLKVQEQNGSGNFEFAACFWAMVGSAVASVSAFLPLVQQFSSAHMLV